jgi:beta-phosphoglucomutase-like phosphatase (HAD superfamily)
MNDLEAILFDLDGVIIDSEPLHEKAFRQTSLHLGRDPTQEEVASLKGTVEEIGAAKLLEYNPAATLSIPQAMEYHNKSLQGDVRSDEAHPGFSGVHPEGT